MGAKAAVIVLVVGLAALTGARAASLPGTWQRLPSAPDAAAIPYQRAGVWTGRQLIVIGRAELSVSRARTVAFAYTPATRRWRTLSPPVGPAGSYEGALAAVWTGREMIVLGPAVALVYTPATNRWSRLPRGPSPTDDAPSGLFVWTGREAITWGGGCCNEVTGDGAAYDPAKRTWRQLRRAPVAGQQRPLGAWTGTELVVLPGTDPAGKPTGGAAYDPAKNAWRRIAPPPQRRVGSNVVWDGRELLVVGGRSLDPKTGASRPATRPLAFNPVTNRWRTLAPIDGGRGREGSGAVWAGTRLLLWGGTTQVPGADPRAPRWALAPYGLAYDPRTDRWTQLPGAPLVGRVEPVAVWTGKAMLVWGGGPNRADVPPPDDRWPFVDGASFTPRRGA